MSKASEFFAGGGSGGEAIGTIKPISSHAEVHTDGNSTWTRAGILLDNTSGTYPNAKASKIAAPTGLTLNVAILDSELQDVTFDGTHYWALGNANNLMYQFDAGGPATGLSQSMAGILDARQLEWMSPHFYVLDFTSGLVIQMNSSGVATGVDFSGMGGVTTGVTVDGTHIYTSGADGFTKYDDAGLLVQYYPRDITPLGYIGSNLIFDGKDFWSGGTVLYGLDTDFKLTGEVINRPNSNHNGATYVQSTDRMLWCDTTQDVVYEYELENYVGYATALTNDNHTGFPFYVKVG